MSVQVSTLSQHRSARLYALLREFSLVLGAALFVALAAQIKIFLPFTPVPLSGQSFAVLLVGALLGARRGAFSLVFYLFAGALGFPVFVGGNAGLDYLFGMTFGYLFGFVIAAYAVGLLLARGSKKNESRAFVFPFLAGIAVIYLFGAGWMALFLGAEKAVRLGVLPFLAGDALKLAAAVSVFPVLEKKLGSKSARR